MHRNYARAAGTPQQLKPALVTCAKSTKTTTTTSPVDFNVYDYGLNGHVWQGSTTHEASQYIDASALADLVIGSVRAT